MKGIIRKYLFKQASLFPWVIVLLVAAMMYYIILGIFIIRETAEGIMAFLIVPYLIPWLLLLAATDYAFRQIFKTRLLKIWLIEAALTLLWGGWYYHRNFYRIEFVTPSVTPIILMIKDVEKGTAPERSFLKQRTLYIIPSDNIIILKTFFRNNEWGHFIARTGKGDAYKQVYPMEYMDKDTIQCDGRSYPIQFFILESDKYPHYRFNDQQFDSLRNAACNKIHGKLPN